MVSPVTHAAGTSASKARSSIPLASSGLVANSTSLGMPASARRSASFTQLFLGRYKARSTKAAPFSEASQRNTPIWQFSFLPAVPEYCGWTPADLVPFFRKPVSSTTSTARSSAKCSTTYSRKSSRTRSVSHSAWLSSLCIPSGVLCLQRPRPSASRSYAPLKQRVPSGKLAIAAWVRHAGSDGRSWREAVQVLLPTLGSSASSSHLSQHPPSWRILPQLTAAVVLEDIFSETRLPALWSSRNPRALEHKRRARVWRPQPRRGVGLNI